MITNISLSKISFTLPIAPPPLISKKLRPQKIYPFQILQPPPPLISWGQGFIPCQSIKFLLFWQKAFTNNTLKITRL